MAAPLVKCTVQDAAPKRCPGAAPTAPTCTYRRGHRELQHRATVTGAVLPLLVAPPTPISGSRKPPQAKPTLPSAACLHHVPPPGKAIEDCRTCPGSGLGLRSKMVRAPGRAPCLRAWHRGSPASYPVSGKSGQVKASAGYVDASSDYPACLERRWGRAVLTYPLP